MIMSIQTGISEEDGHWKDVVKDKPEGVVSLEIGDDFVGIFLSREENTETEYKDKISWIYKLKTENGKTAKMYSTTDLDYSMKKLSPNTRIRILRLDDKPMPPPKQPMQIYKVQEWVEGGG